MKKLLCVLLVLSLLPVSGVFANAPVDGIVTQLPDSMSASVTYTEKEGFYKAAGETPWGFEYAPVGTNDYQPFEFIESGWFHKTFNNWSYGAVQFYGSMHAGSVADPAVSFTAPFDGMLQIHKAAVKKGETNISDGVQFKIFKNDTQIFPQTDWAVVLPGTQVDVPDLIFEVKTGDVLRFRLNCIKNEAADGVSWPKTISYLQEEAKASPGAGVTEGFDEGVELGEASQYTDDFTGQNPDSPWKFQNAEVGSDEYHDLIYINGWFSGYYQNWRAGAVPYPGTYHPGEAGDCVATFVCPEDGMLALPSSTVEVKNEKSDGARFSITKNTLPIFPEMGMILVKGGRKETVPDLLFAVKKGDEIHFRVNCNANQNYDGVSWNPKVAYAKNVEIVPDGNVFEDVEGHWAEDAVNELFGRGIVVGKGEGRFDPEAQVTRAEFLTMVQKAAGIPVAPYDTYYSDVAPNSWYTSTIVSAFVWDLIADELTPQGKFLPDQPILREEMTAIMVDTLQNLDFKKLEAGDLFQFKDKDETAAWVQDAVAQAVKLGLILGNPDGTFAPKATATRAESAVILQRLLKTTEGEDPEGTYSEVYGKKVYSKGDVQKLITDAYKSGQKSVTIPEGAYRLWMNGAEGHIVLRDMSDFTINAYGVTFLYQTINSPGIFINNCENLTINGLVSDYENVGYYQGKVIAKAEDNRYVDIWVDPAYPHHLLDSGEFYGSPHALNFDENYEPIPNLVNGGGASSIDKIGQYKYRFYIAWTSEVERMKVGGYVNGRAKVGDNISISNCGPIHMKDVTVYTGLTGVGENHTNGGSTYENLQIIPGPAPEGATIPRLVSVNGTGYFARSVRKGAVMNNIKVLHTNDDGINVHSVYGRVAGQEDPKTVIVALGSYDDFIFPVGDTLRFSQENGVQMAEAKIASVQRTTYTPATDLSDVGVSGPRSFGACYRLTLDRNVKVEPRYLVENASLPDNGIIIRNSEFGYNRPRAILSHANDALIENCTFDKVYRCAILVAPELDWGESGYSHNVTIRNCVFKNSGFANNKGAAIDVSGYEGREHKNITIENCTFQDQYRADIIANSITGGLIQNNSFGKQNPNAQAVGIGLVPAVTIDNTQDLILKDNTFQDEGRKASATVKTENIQGL